MHLAGLVVAAALAFGGLACHSNEPAPRCFYLNEAGECVLFPPGLELSVTCAPEDGVALADYSSTVTTNIDADRLTFSAENLPAGLKIDTTSGVISGKPTQEGTYDDVIVTATTLDGSLQATTTCDEFKIDDRLRVDVSNLPGGCLTFDRELSDFVSGGTGNAVRCELPASSNATLCPMGGGNGEIPDGLDVQEDCTITGTIESESRGSFAWIVHAIQDGAIVPVPYCAAHDIEAEHAVQISVNGAAQSDDLTPIRIYFDPQDNIDLETSSPLRFDVTAPCEGGECDRVQVNFGATCSPIAGSSSNAVEPVTVIEVDGANRGLTHPLNLGTTTLVDEKYRTRPWITSIAFTYCTNEGASESACGDATAGRRITHFALPIVAWPQDP